MQRACGRVWKARVAGPGWRTRGAAGNKVRGRPRSEAEEASRCPRPPKMSGHRPCRHLLFTPEHLARAGRERGDQWCCSLVHRPEAEGKPGASAHQEGQSAPGRLQSERRDGQRALLAITGHFGGHLPMGPRAPLCLLQPGTLSGPTQRACGRRGNKAEGRKSRPGRGADVGSEAPAAGLYPKAAARSTASFLPAAQNSPRVLGAAGPDPSPPAALPSPASAQD